MLYIKAKAGVSQEDMKRSAAGLMPVWDLPTPKHSIQGQKILSAWEPRANANASKVPAERHPPESYGRLMFLKEVNTLYTFHTRPCRKAPPQLITLFIISADRPSSR